MKILCAIRKKAPAAKQTVNTVENTDSYPPTPALSRSQK